MRGTTLRPPGAVPGGEPGAGGGVSFPVPKGLKNQTKNRGHLPDF